MTPREHFESKGMLKKSQSKPYTFAIGRLMGDLRWGCSCWSSLSDRGTLQDNWARVGATHNVDGQTIYSIYIWRLAIVLGWAK